MFSIAPTQRVNESRGNARKMREINSKFNIGKIGYD